MLDVVSFEKRKSFPILKRTFNVETCNLVHEHTVRDKVSEAMKEMWRYKFEDVPKYGLLVMECSLKTPQKANRNAIRAKIRRFVDSKTSDFYSIYEDALIECNNREDRENNVPIIIHSIRKEERLCLNNTSIDKGWIIQDGKRIFLNYPHAHKIGGIDY